MVPGDVPEMTLPCVKSSSSAQQRTAIGSFQGSLAQIPAAELGATVIRALLDETQLDPALVEEVVMGHVLTAAAGQNTARQAAIKAGLPVTTPALTINKVCGSGLKAVHLAAQSILLGEADVVVAGGMESMSLAPHARAAACETACAWVTDRSSTR